MFRTNSRRGVYSVCTKHPYFLQNAVTTIITITCIFCFVIESNKLVDMV